MRVFACFEPEGALLEKIKEILGEKNLTEIFFKLEKESAQIPREAIIVFKTGKGKHEPFFGFKTEKIRYGVTDNVLFFDLKLFYKPKINKTGEKEFFQKWKTDWRKFNPPKK